MTQTHWPRVWAAFLAGCIGAFQIGKTFASLPTIIAELGLSLFQAGLILSLFSLIAAFAGAGLGLLSDRIGHLHTALAGLVTSAGGSFLGATASGIDMLLISRLIEGFGFIITIVALPSLISRSAIDAQRPLVMGIWDKRANKNKELSGGMKRRHWRIDDRHPGIAGMAWLAWIMERCRHAHAVMDGNFIYQFYGVGG